MLAIFLPAVIAISAQILQGPDRLGELGDTIPGTNPLALAGLLWIGYDFTRVTRTRRDVLRLAQFDTAWQAVDTAVTGRDLLKSLRGITIPRARQRRRFAAGEVCLSPSDWPHRC